MQPPSFRLLPGEGRGGGSWFRNRVDGSLASGRARPGFRRSLDGRWNRIDPEPLGRCLDSYRVRAGARRGAGGGGLKTEWSGWEKAPGLRWRERRYNPGRALATPRGAPPPPWRAGGPGAGVTSVPAERRRRGLGRPGTRLSPLPRLRRAARRRRL